MSQTKRSTSSKLLIILAVLFAMVLVVCGGPFTWWFNRRQNAFAELEARRNEIASRGLPIDDASMESFRQQTMSQDMSQRWMDALERLRSDEFEESCRGVPTVGIVEEEVVYEYGKPYRYDSEVRQFLEKWTGLRKEIHEIVEGTGPIWTEVQFDSYRTELHDAQTTRSAARLLSLEFEDALRRDDHDQAFHSLMALIGVSRAMQQEPVLITQLVRIAVGNIACNHLKTAIELDALDEKQLVALMNELKALDDFAGMYKLAIAGERAMAQPMFDDLSQFSDDVGNVPSGINQRPVDALASLDVMAQGETLPDDDLTAFLRGAVAIDEEFSRQMEQANWLKKLDTVLTALTVPALGAAGKAFVRSAMEIRIAKVAIGVRLYEKRNGSLPESLEQLTVENIGVDLNPIDPVGGKPFGYRVSGDKAELWGFNPESPDDSTPDQPTDPESLSENDSFLEYWTWNLPKANSP